MYVKTGISFICLHERFRELSGAVVFFVLYYLHELLFRIVGFEELGGSDDFRTIVLERRLAKAGTHFWIWTRHVYMHSVFFHFFAKVAKNCHFEKNLHYRMYVTARIDLDVQVWSRRRISWTTATTASDTSRFLDVPSSRLWMTIPTTIGSDTWPCVGNDVISAVACSS